MPPNRKTSAALSDDFILSSRLRLANPHLQPTIVTAKDAVVVKPVDDVESYWHWPTAASLPPAPPQASDDDDNETARRNNDQKATIVVDLFSAHHIVANLIREASRQEEKPQQQQRPEHPPREHIDDDGPASSTTTATAATTTIIDDDDNDLQRTYWDWTQPAATIDPAHIDDRYTSGLAIERNLVRDAATVASSHTTTTTAATTTTLVADHDSAWDWVTFPRRAAERKFSHEHYERHLVRHSNSGMPVVVVPLVPQHHDDYWHGL
jgi:hypothetical protein